MSFFYYTLDNLIIQNVSNLLDYTSVKMFSIWRLGDKIAIFHSSWIYKLFPREKILTNSFRKVARALCHQFWLPIIWLLEGIFSISKLKSSTTTIRVVEYQYNHYNKTLIQCIDFSIIKHLFTACGWSSALSNPRQKQFPSGKPSGNISFLGLNKRAFSLTIIK